MFCGRLGWPELVILLVIVLLVFGIGKLPQIGGAIGKTIREFRKNSKVEDEEKPESSTVSTKTDIEDKQVNK